MLTLVIVVGLLCAFVLAPLGRVLATSLESPQGTTFSNYTDLLAKSYNRRALLNSLVLGGLVSLIGTSLAFGLAWSVTRMRWRYGGVLRALLTLPIISPPFVIALAAILLFGRNGWITGAILRDGLGVDIYGMGFDIYGLGGLVAVQVTSLFPLAFLMLCGVLEAIDPALEEAAADLGASPRRVFRTVTLRLSLPALGSSALLLFIESLADFGNPLVIGGRYSVLSVQAYLQIVGQHDIANGAVLAITLVAPTLVAFAVQKWVLERKSAATVTGKPSGAMPRRPGPLGHGLGYGLIGGTLAVIALLYGTVVYGSLTRLWGADHTLTFASYGSALRIGGDYLWDSVIVAAIATPITGAFGLVTAYLVTRVRFPGRGLLELVAMLTFAVPGTVVGIGYLQTFAGTPLQGTAAIIVILFVFRNAPVGLRAGVTALHQISPSIEEASRDLGAGPVTTFRRIVLPLVAPAFASGLVYAFVRCMTAISAVIFVVSGRWNMVTVAILGFVENSDLSQAAALCVILAAVVMVAMIVIQGAIRRWIAPRGAM